MKIEILAWAMIPLLLAIPVARAADARAEASDEEHSVYASLLAERWDESPFSASGSCGSLCGGGEYFWLRKIDGKWRIVASTRGWVS